MAIGDDFSVAANGDIRVTGGTANYTVIALHRWLGDLMDDAQAAGNDILDITDATASERSTDNIITLKSPYNIDDTLAQRLYDGSVIQTNGDVIYDGILVFAAAGMYLAVVQNGALVSPNFWTTGLNADAASGISHRFLLKVRTAAADIDGRRLIGQTREFGNSYSEFKIGGGTARGNNVMALTYATDLNNATAAATVAGWTTITNTEGYRAIDVDGNAVNENYYSEWNKDTYTINQFYERMKWLTRRGSASTIYGLNGELLRGITHEINTDTPDDTGVIAMSVSAGLTFDRATGSFVTDGFVAGEKIRSSGFTNAGNNTDKIISTVAALSITVTVTTGLVAETAGVDERIQGLFDDTEAISWSGGTGRMVAINSRVNPTKIWMQLLTGVIPTDNQVITSGTSVATCQMNVTITERTLSFPFVGSSTGSAIIGAYGFGIEAADLTASDKLFDLTNTQRVPPNNVTFTVSGLFSTEDRLLVGPAQAGVLDEDQLTLSTSLSGASETAVVCTTAIPTDTPTSGTIRIQLNSGIYRRVAYTSFTSATFTIAGTSFTADPATAPKNVYISYIDKVAGAASETVTWVYSSDRSLFIRVRDGGSTPIKTFETTGTMGSAGGSSTAIRTADT